MIKNKQILATSGNGLILEFWSLNEGGYLVWLKKANQEVIEKHFYKHGEKERAALQYDILQRNRIQGLTIKKAFEQISLFA